MNNRFSFDTHSDGSLVLTVGEACIQTAAKRAYRELTAALLEEEASAAVPADVGRLVDILERFLSTTDFSALRAEHPKLAGGTRCLVRLSRCEDGRVSWEMV